MFILSCSWVRLVECRGIESQALKAQILPSRPEEFHLQPLTDSVREPLDSYGSCRPPLQILPPLELRNNQSSSHFRLTLVPHRPTHPLRSIPITETSTLLWGYTTIAQALVLSPFVYNL